METSEIRQKFDDALRSFYADEELLIKYKVSERALTHKLAEHLQKLFSNYNVDCEYNRVGNSDRKRLDLLMGNDPNCPGDCDQCTNNRCVIFPDIIVHHRGTDDNLLVIEAKTVWGKRSQERDFTKLEKLTASKEYHYQLGIAFHFAKTYAEALKNVIEYPIYPVPGHGRPCSPVPRGKK